MKRLIEQEGIDWVESNKDAISNDGQTVTIDKDLQVNGSISGDEISESDLSQITCTTQSKTWTSSSGQTVVFTPEMVKVEKVGNTIGIHMIIKAVFDALTSSVTIPDYTTIADLIRINLPTSILNKISVIGEELTWCEASFTSSYRYSFGNINFYSGLIKQDYGVRVDLASSSAGYTIYKGGPVVRSRADFVICLNDNLIS